RNILSDSRNGFRGNWDPGIPEAPENLMEYAELKLTVEEAEYLEERISCKHNGTLLYYLINKRVRTDADYFWELPLISSLPDGLQYNITHACNFSETIYGASLFYNFLLARSRKDIELIEKYREKLKGWSDNIKDNYRELYEWYHKLQGFWSSQPLREARIP